MKICILSDSHDHISLIDAAVAEAKAAGAEAVLHCGDVVAPSTLHCLEHHGLPVHVIHGNNVGDLYTLGRMAADPGNCIHYHGMDAGLGGVTITDPFDRPLPDGEARFSAAAPRILRLFGK